MPDVRRKRRGQAARAAIVRIYEIRRPLGRLHREPVYQLRRLADAAQRDVRGLRRLRDDDGVQLMGKRRSKNSRKKSRRKINARSKSAFVGVAVGRIAKNHYGFIIVQSPAATPS